MNINMWGAAKISELRNWFGPGSDMLRVIQVCRGIAGDDGNDVCSEMDVVAHGGHMGTFSWSLAVGA